MSTETRVIHFISSPSLLSIDVFFVSPSMCWLKISFACSVFVCLYKILHFYLISRKFVSIFLKPFVVNLDIHVYFHFYWKWLFILFGMSIKYKIKKGQINNRHVPAVSIRIMPSTGNDSTSFGHSFLLWGSPLRFSGGWFVELWLLQLHCIWGCRDQDGINPTQSQFIFLLGPADCDCLFSLCLTIVHTLLLDRVYTHTLHTH